MSSPVAGGLWRPRRCRGGGGWGPPGESGSHWARPPGGGPHEGEGWGCSWGGGGARRMGQLAISAQTALTEDAFIASFARTVGTDAWPDVDLRVTSTRCSMGERAVWDRSSGIPLQRAVASSCAIPGFYPTVTFRGEHYMDGPRGAGYNADIVSGDGLDAVLFLGPD